MKTSDVAIRKRTQIAKANRTMFLWIAAASALVGAALVVSYFMAQKLVYNEKVLAAKSQTVSTLENNNRVVSDLQDEIRVLDTNPALNSIKANESDQAIQVILDALPSEANSLALGASLQNRLLTGIDGLTLESIQVDPVVGVETITSRTARRTSQTTESTIRFQFVVTGSDAALKQVLQNLERSIRTIKVNNVVIAIQGSGPTMTVQGEAYYEPAKTVELTEETIQP